MSQSAGTTTSRCFATASRSAVASLLLRNRSHTLRPDHPRLGPSQHRPRQHQRHLPTVATVTLVAVFFTAVLRHSGPPSITGTAKSP
jgi:hypothetical protein